VENMVYCRPVGTWLKLGKPTMVIPERSLFPLVYLLSDTASLVTSLVRKVF
jgi:hypothetical protein